MSLTGRQGEDVTLQCSGTAGLGVLPGAATAADNWWDAVTGTDSDSGKRSYTCSRPYSHACAGLSARISACANILLV